MKFNLKELERSEEILERLLESNVNIYDHEEEAIRIAIYAIREIIPSVRREEVEVDFIDEILEKETDPVDDKLIEDLLEDIKRYKLDKDYREPYEEYKLIRRAKGVEGAKWEEVVEFEEAEEEEEDRDWHEYDEW